MQRAGGGRGGGGNRQNPHAGKTFIQDPGEMFVGNLVKDGDIHSAFSLRQFFSQFGEITDVDVKTDRDGVSKGYAFLKFADPASVESVLMTYNDNYLGGVWLDCKRSVDRAKRDPPKGRGRGDDNGGGNMGNNGGNMGNNMMNRGGNRNQGVNHMGGMMGGMMGGGMMGGGMMGGGMMGGGMMGGGMMNGGGMMGGNMNRGGGGNRGGNNGGNRGNNNQQNNNRNRGGGNNNDRNKPDTRTPLEKKLGILVQNAPDGSGVRHYLPILPIDGSGLITPAVSGLSAIFMDDDLQQLQSAPAADTTPGGGRNNRANSFGGVSKGGDPVDDVGIEEDDVGLEGGSGMSPLGGEKAANPFMASGGGGVGGMNKLQPFGKVAGQMGGTVRPMPY